MSDRGVATRRLDARRRVVKQAHAPRRERPTRGDVGAPAVALYIADMTAQLESMATAAGLDLLAYFLAMARAESEAASRDGAVAASEDVRSA
jgi:hypothetical protein